jgi:hypothetical protein
MNGKHHPNHKQSVALACCHDGNHTGRVRRMAAFSAILSLLIAAAPLDASDRTIDILVVYTPAVTAHHGTHDGVAAHVHTMIESTNIAYANSGINGQVRLVGLEEVNYVEASDSQETDLSRMRQASDGHLDEVYQLRNNTVADLVCLLRKGAAGGMAGVAYLMDSASGSPASCFSVVGTEFALSFTFAHETGHNLGAHHARGDRFNGEPAWGGLFPHSNGHRFYGSSGILYRTIMAYSPGIQIPHFSNPGIDYNNTATGVPQNVPESADNAATLNATIPVVAAYREYRAPELTAYPANQFVNAPYPATFSAWAVGEISFTYQWQVSTDHGSTWNNISGANADSYNTGETDITMNGYRYRCLVIDPFATQITQSASLTVNVVSSSPLAVWDFSGEPGNQQLTAGLPCHPGITVQPLTRGPALTAVSGTNSINSKGWSTTEERNSDAYYEFGVRFAAGFIGTIESIAFAESLSWMGPARFILTSSLDNYQQAIGGICEIPDSPSPRDRLIPLGTGFPPVVGDVRFRLYAFKAMGNSGAWRLRNPNGMSGLSILGSVEELQPVDFDKWISRPEIPTCRRGLFESAASDGTANIVKYFQGLGPMESASGAGLLAVERIADNQMNAWFRRSLVTDGLVSGTVRWSRDLNNWHPNGATSDGTTVSFDMSQTKPDPANLSREWVRVAAIIEGPLPGSMFLRLDVDNHIPGQTIVLDSYDNATNFDAGRYIFHPVHNSPVDQIAVEDGVLRIYPGGESTAAHLWNGGQKLSSPGDWVSIDVVSAVNGGAGLYLTGDMQNPQSGTKTRLFENAGILTFQGPWGDAELSSAPIGPVILKIEVLEVSGAALTLRATLSGNGFITLVRDFGITADDVYFGPIAYSAYAEDTHFQAFDNLTIHKNFTVP